MFDEILTFLERHICLTQKLLFLFIFQDSLNFSVHSRDVGRPFVCYSRFNDPRCDLCSLGFCCFDSLLDDFSVGLGSDGAGSSQAASTSSSPNTMKVNLMRLWRFEVYYY